MTVNLLAIISALIFPVLASYFNVVISRGFRASLRGRSVSDLDGRILNWWELIPVFSSGLIWLGNKISNNRNISVKYFLTELMALIFGLLWSHFAWIQLIQGDFLTVYFSLLLVLLLLFIAQEDIWELQISVNLVIAAIFLQAFLLLLDIAQMEISNADFTQRFISAWIFSLGTICIILYSRGKGMGIGDVLLSFLIGLSFGMPFAFIAIMAVIYSAAIVSLPIIIMKRKIRGLVIPLVPFYSFSLLLINAFGEEIWGAINQIAKF